MLDTHCLLLTMLLAIIIVFGSLLPCIFVASFINRVQHEASVISIGLLTGKTLSEVFVAYIVCIVDHRNGSNKTFAHNE